MEPRMNWNFEVCPDHDISHIMLRHAFFVCEGNIASDYVHDVFADDFADRNPQPTVLAGKPNLRLMNWWKVDRCHSFRHPQTPLNPLKRTIVDRLYWLPTSGTDPTPAIDFIFLTSGDITNPAIDFDFLPLVNFLTVKIAADHSYVDEEYEFCVSLAHCRTVQVSPSRVANPGDISPDLVIFGRPR
ncbi:hypothetical protein V9T40_002159 [Parthenolecanium corni]|uniref:Uncharacterized protein n=1 Tax=Parthenolecanium corni TaxID=536013 RepID=A0AAN9THZ4_9HEMI